MIKAQEKADEMIKHVHNTKSFGSCTVGFIQLIEWISLNIAMPENSGTYLISTDDGNVIEAEYCNNHTFHNIIFNYGEPHSCVWFNNNKDLTPEEILQCCYSHAVWYYIDESDLGEDLIVIFNWSDIKYWTDCITGPTNYDDEHSPIHTTEE